MALWKALEDLEKDVHLHLHLENKILFPRAADLAEQGA
jgi:iron-sulfur cluster repair protein YtfE (RIC family)